MIRIITLILILIDYFDDFVFLFINSNLMIWEFLYFYVNDWEYNAHWLHHILVFEELQRLQLDVLRVRQQHVDLHVLRLSAHLRSLCHVFLDFVLLGDHIISETIAEVKVFLGVLLIIVTQYWFVGLGKL